MKLAVLGAGAIGCWVGGRLASDGAADVTLVGRARVLEALGDGLVLRDLDGRERRVAASRLTRTTDATACADADVVLVTVKSAQTAAAAAELAPLVSARTIVVSLQNGVRNPDILRAALPGRTVLAAMVPFNVVRHGDAFQRTTGGTLRIEASSHTAAIVAAFATAGLPLQARRDMPAVLWAKLLLNLNNAINALAGVPLVQELRDRAFRRCLAAAQREAVGLLARAKQPVARLTAIPPRWMPRLLELPDVVFDRLAPRILTMDATARSSMWDDLEARRATEIDYLQGEVVAVAARLGKSAPINAKLVALVRNAEGGGKRDFTGDELASVLAV